MSHDTPMAQRLTLPMIPLGGVVAFPAITLNFELTDDPSLAAAEAADRADGFVFLCPLHHPIDGELTEKDLFSVGTVAKIKQTVKTPEGEMRLVCEGFARASLLSLRRFADFHHAEVVLVTESLDEELELHTEATLRAAKTTLRAQKSAERKRAKENAANITVN